MPRLKDRNVNVSTGVVTETLMTLEEEVIDDARIAQLLADKPMKDWKDSMQATDSTCPRWFEDYVTENSVALANGKAKDSYDAKVQLRSEKP